MKAETKDKIKTYLETIGGIENIKKDNRICFIKFLIKLIDSKDYDKIKSFYPFSIMNNTLTK